MKALAKSCLNRVLRRYGHEVVWSELLYDWQRTPVYDHCWNNCQLPNDALKYLKPDNPKLINLQQRYRAFDSDVTKPLVWTDHHVRTEDIAYFRGDNAWVWQVRGGKNANILAYAISAYYLRSIDRFGLLEKLPEDNSFGNFTYQIGGRQVSRDLLDSVAEIYFLDRHLGLGSREGFRVLDIGAGYGRLAHRMTALTGIERYYCTDAVAVSTFVSDYYLRFRDATKAVVIPLDEIENTLRSHPVDLAINIHSFPECQTKAIEWWVRLLSKYHVKNLMVVPNGSNGGGEPLITSDGHDFLPILERYGYRVVVREPKFLDPVVQEHGVQPTWHHLLELRNRN